MRGCEAPGGGGGQAEDNVNEILIFMEVATKIFFKKLHRNRRDAYHSFTRQVLFLDDFPLISPKGISEKCEKE